MRIAACALTYVSMLAILVSAGTFARAQQPLPPYGPAFRRFGPPFMRPMGPPFMRPFGTPMFRRFGPAGPPVVLEGPGGPLRPVRPWPQAPRGRICFNPEETREKIATFRLTEPFRALRMGGAQGEPLRAKLCRWKGDQFVYEVAVLRRDGRIVRVYMNAQNGQSVGAIDDADHP